MPLGPGIRYRVKVMPSGKKVRLAFKGDKVVEATGMGGGNPVVDKIKVVAKQALQSGIPILQLKDRSEQYLYDPKSKKIFPSGIQWTIDDAVTNIKQEPDPVKKIVLRNKLAQDMVMMAGMTRSPVKVEPGYAVKPPASMEKGNFRPIDEVIKEQDIAKGRLSDVYDAVSKEPRIQGQIKNLSDAGKKMTIENEVSRRRIINEPNFDYLLKRAGATPEEIASGKITVYRATENGKILPGDFVTPDKEIVKPYFNQRVEVGKNPKIVSQKVYIKDLVIGDEITDFVYRPSNVAQPPLTDVKR